MPSFNSAVVAFAAALAVVSNPQGVDAQEPCGTSIILKASENLGLTLGSLYDKTNSNALGGKFWIESKIAENRYELFDSKEEVLVKIMNDRKDRRNLLDISAEIGIDMELASGTKVTGSASGKFVNHARRAGGTTALAMAIKRRTVTHVVGEELIQKLVPNSMHFGGEATHVVTRVDYGASVVANFEYADSTVEDADDLDVKAQLGIEAEAFKINGKLEVRIGSSQNETLMNSEVSLFSDIPLTTEGITYEDGLQAVREFDDAFLKVNGGIGVPISFQLMPLCFWESDKAGRFLRELNAKILNELMDLFDSFYDVQDRARRLGRSAGRNGLPTLLYQCEDLGLAVSQFFGRMRVGFVQLLPKIRAGTLGETEIVDFMENIKNSPFAPFAVNRWLDGALEMIMLQSQIRAWVELISEDTVTTVKTFSDLQQFLRSPAVDTVVAFAHVGKPNGLSTHVQTMQRYLKDSIPEGYNGLFETNKFLQNVENTVRTRNAMELLRRFAQPKKYVCALAGCVWKRQVMVYMDFQSYKDELTSMGAPLETSSLMLWQRGLLVNPEYKDCVSETDPRDHLTGECLWSGQNDIPDGNRCSADLNDESRGCKSSCASDGYCRATECPRQEEYRDFIFLGRRTNTNLGGVDGTIDGPNQSNIASDQYSGILSIRAQSTDTATTVFATRSDVIWANTITNSDSTKTTTYDHADPGMSEPGRWRWVSPGLIMSADFDNMCLQVVRQLNADLTFDYSQVSLRPCNKYVDYQLWEVSNEWGLPKFKIVRPNKKATEEEEYCLTVRWGVDPSGSESVVRMEECTEDNDDQSFFEGFQIHVGNQNLKFTDFRTPINEGEPPETATLMISPEEDDTTFFFWRDDKIATFGLGYFDPYVLRSFDDPASTTNEQILRFAKPNGGSDYVPLFKPKGAQISLFDRDMCLEADDESNASGLRLRKCDSANRNQDVYDCNVQLCEPTTCTEYGTTDVAFCVDSSAPGSTGPQCYCKPGYGQIGSDLACVNIVACETAACDLEDYCIDFPPPAPDGGSGRACVPRTGCAKGFRAVEFPAMKDVQCEKCPLDTYQNQDAFFGEECTPYSAACGDGESQEEGPTPVNDRLCKNCAIELCKEIEEAPPQTSAQVAINAKSTKGFAGMGSVVITDNGDPALTSFVEDPTPWYVLGGVAMFLFVVLIWYLKRKCSNGRGKGSGGEAKKATKPKRQTKKEKKAAANAGKDGGLSPGQFGMKDNDPSGGLGAQRSPGSQDPGFGVTMGGGPSGATLDV